MGFPNLRPSVLADKLLSLFLRIVLAVLLKILYIIKGEDVKVTRVEVTVQKANEEKRYTHVIDASKEREINPKDLIKEQTAAKEERQTKPNLVTGTPSELKPEEINNEDDKSEETPDSGIKSSFEKSEIPHTYSFEMKTSHNGNNNESDILPFEFHWNHGGQEAIITGDFDNWQKTHKMKFNPTTKNFVTTINIDPNKQHKFKFVIDGDWQPNYDYPTNTDEHGNVNNIIYSFPASPLGPEYKEYATSFSQLTAAY